MNEKETQQPLGVVSDLNNKLDCYFNQIIKSLINYNETRLFDTPNCLKKCFTDFVETNKELQMGGFVDNKTHCYVHFDKITKEVKRYYNGVAI